MDRITKAISEINDLGQNSDRSNWLNNTHPLAKLMVTILYLVVTVSFPKAALVPLFSMAVYPLFIFLAADISIKKALYRMRVVLPLVIFMGIFNPIFDTTPFCTIMLMQKSLTVTSGMITGITLVLKGILTVFATYILICSTSLESICGSLKRLHFPEVMVIQIMLTFRYITVLLSEVSKINQAYQLRAPNQKGIHFTAWGSLVGNLLLHSFDRAQDIYQAMCLRGFKSEYFLYNSQKFKAKDFIFLLIWCIIFLTCRYIPVFTIIGRLFQNIIH